MIEAAIGLASKPSFSLVKKIYIAIPLIGILIASPYLFPTAAAIGRMGDTIDCLPIYRPAGNRPSEFLREEVCPPARMLSVVAARVSTLLPRLTAILSYVALFTFVCNTHIDPAVFSVGKLRDLGTARKEKSPC